MSCLVVSADPGFFAKMFGLGKNDAGADFPLKDESQKLFLDFFGTGPDDPRRKQKGVYSAAILGPFSRFPRPSARATCSRTGTALAMRSMPR